MYEMPPARAGVDPGRLRVRVHAFAAVSRLEPKNHITVDFEIITITRPFYVLLTLNIRVFPGGNTDRETISLPE